MKRERLLEKGTRGGSLQELPEERPGRAGAVDTGDWLLVADGVLVDANGLWSCWCLLVL